MVTSLKKIVQKHPLLHILILAVLVRTAFVFAFPVPMPGSQFGIYDTVAQYFASGEGFGLLKHIQPGWPSILGTLYTFAGRSAAAIYGLQIFLGTLMVWGIYRLARYSFQEKRLALVVGAASSIWPMFVLTTAEYSGTNNLLFTTLLVFAVYYLLKGILEERIPEAAFAGLLLGFAVWTDVVALYLPVVLLITLTAHAIWIRKTTLRRLAVPIVLLIVLVSLLGSWTYRNHVVFETNITNQKLNQRFPSVVAPGAGAKIPIVAKGKETEVFDKQFWRQVLQSKPAKVVQEAGSMFIFPYSLRHLTSSKTTISYKKELQSYFAGEKLSNKFRWSVAAGKAFLTILHWLLLVLGLWGVWSLRRHPLGALTFSFLLYMMIVSIVASLGYVPSATAPEPYFLFPVTPLMLIVAVYKICALRKGDLK